MHKGSSTPSDLRVTRPTKTLRELALEKMRDAILNFHFTPGQRLVERQLCEQLGVSRTVVREVLRHLEAEGLVQTPSNRGPIVAVIDPEIVAQIYELRATLEVLAARACAQVADPQSIKALERALKSIIAGFEANDIAQVLKDTTKFYEVLFLSSGRTVAWEIVRNLDARNNALRAMSLSSKGRSKSGPDEMRQIVEAIKKGDPDAAEQACRYHVERAYEIVRSRVDEVSGDTTIRDVS